MPCCAELCYAVPCRDVPCHALTDMPRCGVKGHAALRLPCHTVPTCECKNTEHRHKCARAYVHACVCKYMQKRKQNTLTCI
eukprot:9038980-Alexandrium_andersonii.AAC.1